MVVISIANLNPLFFVNSFYLNNAIAAATEQKTCILGKTFVAVSIEYRNFTPEMNIPSPYKEGRSMCPLGKNKETHKNILIPVMKLYDILLTSLSSLQNATKYTAVKIR